LIIINSLLTQASTRLPFLSRLAGIVERFDYAILMFFNSLATRSWYFDNFVRFICDSQIIKSGLIVSFLWWFWFRPGDDRQKRDSREKVVSTIAASLVTLFLARSLAVILPFRQRPIADAALNFKLPLGLTTSSL